MIQTHALSGYNILKSVDFPWPIAQTILQHHERLDGSGYPSGITDGDIIIEAKNSAVADVVEAMMSTALTVPHSDWTRHWRIIDGKGLPL